MEGQELGNGTGTLSSGLGRAHEGVDAEAGEEGIDVERG